MRNYIATLLTASAFLFLLSCDDAGPKSLATLTGEYSGMFYVQYANEPIRSNPVIVTFSGDNYVGSLGTDRIPAGGSGNFLISSDSITFSDINMWTADFDWNLILKGTYSFIETESKIILTKGTNDGSALYRYELDRI